MCVRHVCGDQISTSGVVPQLRFIFFFKQTFILIVTYLCLGVHITTGVGLQENLGDLFSFSTTEVLGMKPGGQLL